jgi:subtilisin family serine protease
MKVLNVIFLVLFASSASTRAGSVQRVLGPSDSVVPGQYVVMFEEGVDPRGLANDLKNSGQADFLREYSIINGFAVHMNVIALENALNNIEGATIYDDMVATATEVQSLGGLSLWGLDRVDQPNKELDNEYKYARDGSNVDVYILDTGIYTNHSDFGERASHGADFTDEGDGDPHGHGTHVAGTYH